MATHTACWANEASSRTVPSHSANPLIPAVPFQTIVTTSPLPMNKPPHQPIQVHVSAALVAAKVTCNRHDRVHQEPQLGHQRGSFHGPGHRSTLATTDPARAPCTDRPTEWHTRARPEIWQTEPMRASPDTFSWKMIVDGPRWSSPTGGVEPTRNAAFSSMFQFAREACRTRPPDDVLGLRLGVAHRREPELHQLLRLPTSDLDLDDAELIDRIEAHAELAIEQERARQRRIDEAAAASKPATVRTSTYSLKVQWNRLTQWSRTNMAEAAQHVIDGADPEEITSAQAGIGLPWPSELIVFYRLAHPTAFLTPLGHFFTLDEMLTARRAQVDSRIEFARSLVDWDDPFAVQASDVEPAGSEAFAFLDAFVPLAGRDGDFYVVDIRPGPLHGCVSDLDREGDSSMRWHSLADMIADLTDSLEIGLAFADIWVPELVKGGLVWDTP